MVTSTDTCFDINANSDSNGIYSFEVVANEDYSPRNLEVDLNLEGYTGKTYKLQVGGLPVLIDNPSSIYLSDVVLSNSEETVDVLVETNNANSGKAETAVVKVYHNVSYAIADEEPLASIPVTTNTTLDILNLPVS